MVLQVYTDASFSWERDIAACGFVILDGKVMIKHHVVLLEKIKTIYHAEFYAIYDSLCHAYLVKGVDSIQVYSDSLAALGICNQKHRENVALKKRRRWLVNSLFTDFFDLMDMFKEEGIEVSFFKVKAHSSNHFNNIVDRSCLKHLRAHLKSKQ